MLINLPFVILAVACVAWTVTQEEIFREPRTFCVRKSKDEELPWYCRKFFYLFTCEYCFSHWVSAVAIYFSGLKLVTDSPAGYVFAFFVTVYSANFIMSAYRRLRLSIKRTNVEAQLFEKELKREDR